MKLFRRIVHPTDFSKASGPAFRRALAMARASRAELRLVHVVEPRAVVLEDSFMTARTWQSIAEADRRDARRRLARLVGAARKRGVRARAVVLEGLPFEQIAREARRCRADLIVIGTHGRTGLARLLLGSVASRVLAHAPCPVLTVRGPR
jgi:nucleotide-binding universal stress UspA family protein